MTGYSSRGEMLQVGKRDTARIRRLAHALTGPLTFRMSPTRYKP